LDHGHQNDTKDSARLGFLAQTNVASSPRLRLDGACSLPAFGVEHVHLHCKGDAMAYDADSLIQLQREMRLRQKHPAVMRPAYEQIMLRIEMMVGAWYIDQFGNRTREIKARD
jgi:hypothetical protein